MRNLLVLLSLTGIALLSVRLSAQCITCTPDTNKSPRPYGFNPPILYLPPDRDTSLVIYFTFPDQVTVSGFTFYPNYAIWVDSLKLDSGLIFRQDNQPFAYNPSDPASGSINFDQPPRYKQYDKNDPSKLSHFVVYQNPGGNAGETPPFGCAYICIKTAASEGSDTLRVKVRAFIPTLGDLDNKDTTNLTPQALPGRDTWLDTTFRYFVVITRNLSVTLSKSQSGAFMSVSPNPAFGGISTVRFTLAQPSELTLRVISPDGREMYYQKAFYPAGEHAQELRLPPGIYIVSVGMGQSWTNQRLVILD